MDVEVSEIKQAFKFKTYKVGEAVAQSETGGLPVQHPLGPLYIGGVWTGGWAGVGSSPEQWRPLLLGTFFCHLSI